MAFETSFDLALSASTTEILQPKMFSKNPIDADKISDSFTSCEYFFCQPGPREGMSFKTHFFRNSAPSFFDSEGRSGITLEIKSFNLTCPRPSANSPAVRTAFHFQSGATMKTISSGFSMFVMLRIALVSSKVSLIRFSPVISS